MGNAKGNFDLDWDLDLDIVVELGFVMDWAKAVTTTILPESMVFNPGASLDFRCSKNPEFTNGNLRSRKS